MLKQDDFSTINSLQITLAVLEQWKLLGLSGYSLALKGSGIFNMSSTWEMVPHPHTRKCPLPSRMVMSMLRSSGVLVRYRR